MIKPIQKWEDVFEQFYDDNEAGGSSRWKVTPDTVKNFIKGLLKEVKTMAKLKNKCTCPFDRDTQREIGHCLSCPKIKIKKKLYENKTSNPQRLDNRRRC